jgi:PadR family transcriptional regulator, regulatory protein PadR
MERDLVLAFMKLHLLHYAAQAPIFGLEMIRELTDHGYTLSPGTLYPLLHSLAYQGYLQLSTKVVGGKVRKYYQTTPAGVAALVDAQARAWELLHEISPLIVGTTPTQPAAERTP